ncbi:probable nucleoredoxin 1 [Zingiber officinale]|uniref:protein-disulfide reductase n=1 Tax=Zingiber officinale TaxID=94328 RepID=A0A8J5ESD3_ZINOF|nr:probable nucleoredoxin 1 [Zingiber officinale]KAG6468134.1 hypothetical protein ZIOFF_072702 [Zingiber officinale]
MAEHDNGVESDGERKAAAATHNLGSLLATDRRDFLLRNNGDQVKISELDGKAVGLYFSASWCGPCQRFTPKLVETYNELSSRCCKFEIVFISADEDKESFTDYFSEMPWLAIPFEDSDVRDNLNDLFDVGGIPYLVVLDADGKVLTTEVVQIVNDYGPEAYPFTAERIQKLKEDEQAAKQNQTIQSLLVTSSRDYVISKDNHKVPVSNLEGKIVGIYFMISSFTSGDDFTKLLVEMYQKLKENGENFEVVQINLDDDESSYDQGFEDMPWLAIPFKDNICHKLVRYFALETIPTLVIIGSDGKTVHSNVTELIEEHGIEAYPFSTEKLKEIAEKEKTKMESQTLLSLLVSGEQDYVIGKDGVKVPVSELVGKHILLYFSAQWCPPCRAFLPKLTEVYHKIKEKDSAFELIFVSSDQDESSFNDFYTEMPWLALPFGDERKKLLSRTFKIYGIPSLVAISPTGKTITTEARDLVWAHGAAAYPFTKERIQEIELEVEETAKGWPEKLKHELHEEHELVKSRRKSYICDRCNDEGNDWSFYCNSCDFDLHPKCALEHDTEITNTGDGGDSVKEGYICDGEVCYKV